VSGEDVQWTSWNEISELEVPENSEGASYPRIDRSTAMSHICKSRFSSMPSSCLSNVIATARRGNSGSIDHNASCADKRCGLAKATNIPVDDSLPIERIKVF